MNAAPKVAAHRRSDADHDLRRIGTRLVEDLELDLVAVGEDREGRYVYVLERIDEDRWRAHRRAVETGEPQAEGMPITAGLAAGERIVTAGVRRISDGMIVRLYGGGA